MWWAYLLTASLVSASGSAGDSGCPCLGSIDLSKFSPVVDYELPTDYGHLCKPHDVDGTYCSGPNSDPWCAESWCWVDPDNCDKACVKSSAWFPSAPLNYSYATCGSVDTFSGFGFECLNATGSTANLVPPLASVTSCMNLTNTSDSCGPLVQGRTNYVRVAIQLSPGLCC